MEALLDGVYDGEVTVGELLPHGDFGLGTFNSLDGEMVILDGICYHLRVGRQRAGRDPHRADAVRRGADFTSETTSTVDTPTTSQQLDALAPSRFRART